MRRNDDPNNTMFIESPMLESRELKQMRNEASKLGASRVQIRDTIIGLFNTHFGPLITESSMKIQKEYIAEAVQQIDFDTGMLIRANQEVLDSYQRGSDQMDEVFGQGGSQ